MRILAIEPYYGGSHKAFLDGWSQRSRHEFTLLTLPAYFWKWRMRHAAVTLADQAAELVDRGHRWDALFCSDMLSLAEFRGMAPQSVASLAGAAYFHENQLTYPARRNDVRDVHFVFTNLTTALAAQGVWWNSLYHKQDFLTALGRWARKVPDYPPTDAVERIERCSQVHWPGIALAPPRSPRQPGPMRICYVSRWEHDKRPEVFFQAVTELAKTNVTFRLDVMGESFGDAPAIFAQARNDLAEHIDQWGYVESPQGYRDILARADVVVSTARHEFFGISVAEAIAAGAWPVVPERLAYPELLQAMPDKLKPKMFWTGQASDLTTRLAELGDRLERTGCLYDDGAIAVRAMERYAWHRAVERMDREIEKLAPL